MNKHSFLLVLLSLLLIIFSISVVACYGEHDMKYDNKKEFRDLITEKYSNSDIEEIEEGILYGKLSYAKLKSKYSIQCLRKTYQGFYALFLTENDKRVFVFMNEKAEIKDILEFDSVKTRKSFDFVSVGKTTENEVLGYDEHSILLPVDSVSCSAHIVQEGVLIVTYNRLDSKSGRLLEYPIVETVDFYGNSEFPVYDNEMLNLNVPYILAIDKK